MFSGPVLADGGASYVQWGVLQVSVANLVVIGLMLLVFVLAVLLPFPQPRESQPSEPTPEPTSEQQR